MAGKGPVVPKFGSWDAENIGYTVFFEKVRENKAAPVPGTAAPPAAPAPRGHDDQEFDPYEYYENLSRNVPSRAPSSHGHQAPAQHYDHLGGNVPSRPPSSHGHGHPSPAQHYPAQHGHPSPAQHYPAQHGHGGYHRRNGSNGSSAASEVSSRASKFSPPRPYQPRYGNSGGSYYQPQQQQQVAGAYAAPVPRHHQQAAPAPRVAASPPRQAPPPVNERRPGQGAPQARAAKAPSAVPKFGVWDEQNANAAAQGFTVQFEKVKRHREVAKAAAPDVPPVAKRQLSPDRVVPTWGHPRRKPKKSFLSKVYGCLFPVVRQ
ncbi:hypothetical protein CFC21_092355 [Triticum aestivum]|uniref:RIN4 pathogenic type III effector avirulence factor Avr cleavage site domain-containing protein n=2 Tax=Triticum aestivum TaxID=4565 RepID=A0A9R1LI96_WHEAT|nr:class E vacuolar protein-sorting machinery protein HSE1-like [Triticum aestivum]KAF7089357.1 hypothetical protein CFC21_092353 [Triticum aestivum]KAF7089359.1 hypothetical protein CFC21_092355 [Triticum aestivum]